jgi:hypothetical protein
MGALEASLLTYPDESDSIDDKPKEPISKPSAQPPRFFNDSVK